MPQQEQTANRPTDYSRWHRRTLPSFCFMTDGDWFEQRKRNGILKTVAYIETIQVSSQQVENAETQYPLWPSKASLINDIENKMGIPSFVVWHNAECSRFAVLRPCRWERPRIMHEAEYRQFLLVL